MIVIYNPTAGPRRATLLWRVLDVLSGNAMRVELRQTQCAGHAAELAREAAGAGHSLIVAAGGDGTIAEVASGLNGSGAALGVIPLGTANVLAQELGLAFSARAVASALAFRRTRPLWPGLASGAAADRLFVQMVGVGLDAVVVHRISRRLKGCLGRTAYVLQTLREMTRYGYDPIRVAIDGVETETGGVVVSKGSLYAGNFLLAPDARPGEPGFSVALFDRNGPAAALMYGAALTLNLLPRAPGMRLLRASRVEFLGEGRAQAQADGDPAGEAPRLIRDAASPIRVVIP